jgi:hypothetical protein
MLPIQEIYGLHAHERTQADMELSAAYIEPVKDYKLPEDAEKVNRIFYEYSAAQGLAYEKITCSSGSYSTTQQIMYRVCRLQTVFIGWISKESRFSAEILCIFLKTTPKL